MTCNDYAALMEGASAPELEAQLHAARHDPDVTPQQWAYLRSLSEMLTEKRQPKTYIERFMKEHPGIIGIAEDGGYIVSTFPDEVEVNGEKKAFCPDKHGLGYCLGEIKCMEYGKALFYCAECWGRALSDGN